MPSTCIPEHLVGTSGGMYKVVIVSTSLSRTLANPVWPPGHGHPGPVPATTKTARKANDADPRPQAGLGYKRPDRSTPQFLWNPKEHKPNLNSTYVPGPQITSLESADLSGMILTEISPRSRIELAWAFESSRTVPLKLAVADRGLKADGTEHLHGKALGLRSR